MTSSITSIPPADVTVVHHVPASPAPPNQATYLIVSIVVASLLFLVGVGGGLLAVNGDPATAFAVGLFTAFWGGPGFGLMAGFALYNLRLERLAGH